jgi:NADH:ubiquinone oxidoreductase subunit E
MTNYYKKHFFFCTNEKQGGKKSCGGENSKELYKYAKDKVRESGKLKKGGIGVSESRCLGRCDFGPSCVVYPSGEWFRYSSKEDIDAIFDKI